MRRHKQRIDRIARAARPAEPVRYVIQWHDEEPPAHEPGVQIIRIVYADDSDTTIQLTWGDDSDTPD